MYFMSLDKIVLYLIKLFYISMGRIFARACENCIFLLAKKKRNEMKKSFVQSASISIHPQVWFSSNLALNTMFEITKKKSPFNHYNFFQSKTIWIFAQKHLDFGQLDTYSKIFPFWRNRCPMYKKNLLEIRAETAFEMTLKIPDFCLMCTIIHLLGQFSSKVWVKSPKKAFYPKPKL